MFGFVFEKLGSVFRCMSLRAVGSGKMKLGEGNNTEIENQRRDKVKERMKVSRKLEGNYE